MPTKFHSKYADLGQRFGSPALPRVPSKPQILAWNEELAQELNFSDLSDEMRTAWFSGSSLPPDVRPVAAAYAGHQFGHFVPSLGDGRALLLGEVESNEKDLFDVQLKGSGPTAFSRAGDGLAALGPVLREYVVSEYMHAMGVSTTRSLAACLTGDLVYRQEAHPGAVLTRIATSHIRVGSFEYHLHREDLESLKALLRYCLGRHDPELLDAQRPAFEFLKKVSARLSDLVAHWMGLGFIHGVLNSDNTSVAGITIDYGPCAFLDEYNPDKVFSSIDRTGRYRFSRQSSILQWNLARLAECLLPMESGETQAERQVILDEYSDVLKAFASDSDAKIRKTYLRKLGIAEERQTDSGIGSDTASLLDLWFGVLQEHTLDYTRSWNALKGLRSTGHSAFFPQDSEKFSTFVSLWRQMGPSELLLSENPVYIPRNHVIEQMIQSAEAGDFSLFSSLRECLMRPRHFDERYEAFERPPLPDERVVSTFCGT